MAEKPPIILSIAGFDPCSGAGITADIKTIAAHGCYGISCITAMTVQSTSGVKRVEASDPILVTDTLEELAGDLQIAAVHIGMLGSGEVADAVADFLGRAGSHGKRLPNIVLDPILKAYVEEDRSFSEMIDMGFDEQLVRRVIRMVDTNEYKRRQAAPGVKITPRAFGRDRRMPITNRFR